MSSWAPPFEQKYALNFELFSSINMFSSFFIHLFLGSFSLVHQGITCAASVVKDSLQPACWQLIVRYTVENTFNAPIVQQHLIRSDCLVFIVKCTTQSKSNAICVRKYLQADAPSNVTRVSDWLENSIHWIHSACEQVGYNVYLLMKITTSCYIC